MNARVIPNVIDYEIAREFGISAWIKKGDTWTEVKDCVEAECGIRGWARVYSKDDKGKLIENGSGEVMTEMVMGEIEFREVPAIALCEGGTVTGRSRKPPANYIIDIRGGVYPQLRQSQIDVYRDLAEQYIGRIPFAGDVHVSDFEQARQRAKRRVLGAAYGINPISVAEHAEQMKLLGADFNVAEERMAAHYMHDIMEGLPNWLDAKWADQNCMERALDYLDEGDDED